MGRQQAKLNVKKFGWAMVYYQLLYNSATIKVKERKENIYRDISERILNINIEFKAFVTKFAGDLIINMLTDSSHNYIFVPSKYLSDNKMERMTQALAVTIFCVSLII